VTGPRIGVVYHMRPQPPSEADTRWFPAGVLTLGVEYRDVTPEDLVELYRDDPGQLAELAEKSPEGGFSDNGVSIHVRGTDDGHEYLRFDVFDDEPHYHYIHNTAPGEPIVNNVVTFDTFAFGEMLPVAIGWLRERLGEMLPRAGGGHLVDRLDPATLGPVIDQIEQIARAAQADLRRTASETGQSTD
jgi:hypothetical protein